MPFQVLFLLFFLILPLSACAERDTLPEWFTGDPQMEPLPQAVVSENEWRNLSSVPKRPTVPDIATRPAQTQKLLEENRKAQILQQQYNPQTIRREAE